MSKQDLELELAKLKADSAELLCEAQMYAQHQSSECRELSECVCGYQAWWDKVEAFMEKP